MARKRSNTVFLAINIVVSLGVALLAITIYSATRPEEDPRARPTIIIAVTVTPDPNIPLPAQALQGTLDAQNGTLTALQRSATRQADALAQAQQAPTLAPDADEANAGEDVADAPTRQPPRLPPPDADLPTVNPELIPPLPQSGGGSLISEAVTATPEDGCERYYVQSGDTASTIATRYNVGLSELLVLNSINDRTVLQIGQELLIPSASCEPDIPPTITPTPQPTFNLTFVAPTATLPDLPDDAQLELVQVLNPGEITSEQVEIRNQGGEINLLGWTLADSEGNTYTFPEVRLVPGSVIRVLTRSGTNTPGFLYWNLNTPVWEAGETVTLSNAAGDIQTLLTVGSGEVIDFNATPEAAP